MGWQAFPFWAVGRFAPDLEPLFANNLLVFALERTGVQRARLVHRVGKCGIRGRVGLAPKTERAGEPGERALFLATGLLCKERMRRVARALSFHDGNALIDVVI